MLATPDYRTGIMRPTRLMHSIAAAIEQVAPVLVVVDNVAATFAGNQNDRVMVRRYVNIWRAIAHGPSKPAVLLLDHPSLSGLTNGTGRGGNMDWRNAVRSALYLRTADEKAEADRGIRILETVKSNYGPPGKPRGNFGRSRTDFDQLCRTSEFVAPNGVKTICAAQQWF